MYNGRLTKMDADDAFAGHIASTTIDQELSIVPSAHKTSDRHPDYHVEARSPKGRIVRIGSAWEARSRAGNDYLSIAINLPGQPAIRCNAVADPDHGPNAYRIIPLAEALAA